MTPRADLAAIIVPRLRARGVPDGVIADALGVTRQAVHLRFGPRPNVPLMRPAPRPVVPPASSRDDTAAERLPIIMRVWRTRRGLSQVAAARALGVDASAWNRWETGRGGCGLPVIVIRLLSFLDKA